MNKTHIINIDNTNKFIEKQQKKNELLHLYFHDILVVGRASIQQKLLGNRLAICLFLYSKNPNFFTSVRPPAPFFKTKLTRTKQLIDYGLAKCLASEALLRCCVLSSELAYQLYLATQLSYLYMSILSRLIAGQLCLLFQLGYLYSYNRYVANKTWYQQAS